MKNIKTSALIAALTLIASGAAQAETTTFTSDAFADFQTIGTTVFNNTGDTVSSVFTNDGGSSSFRVTVSQNDLGNALHTHDLLGSTFNTATGEVTSIDFSIDLSDPGLFDADTPIYFGLTQGGEDYLYNTDGSLAFEFRRTNIAFATLGATGIVASNFDAFTGDSRNGVTDGENPDFVSGGSIQFFITTQTSRSRGDGVQTRATDMNNVVIGVNYTPVPEPSSYALLAGLTGLTFVMLRRRA